jgi:sugar-specific transcriptional regulator TrmB
MQKELQKIGFNEKEAKVYLALLELGEVTIGPLEKKLNIHKQIIYNVLDGLIKKEVVKVNKKNGQQHFFVNDPDILLDHHKSQEIIIKTLIPKLQTLEGAEKNISDIKVYSGVKAFQLFHYKKMKDIPTHSEVCVIGGGGEEFLKIAEQKYFFNRFENLRIHKKISHKILMYENQRNTPKYINRRYQETRFLLGDLEHPMSIQIWPHCSSLLLFDDDNPQIIEIKSKKIRDGFKNYFDTLWKMAKK